VLLWRNGVRRPHRVQFWRQLWGIYRQNPSRLKIYVLCCGLGEDLFALREEMLRRYAQAG
jgi:hypothetical protein